MKRRVNPLYVKLSVLILIHIVLQSKCTTYRTVILLKLNTHMQKKGQQITRVLTVANIH